MERGEKVLSAARAERRALSASRRPAKGQDHSHKRTHGASGSDPYFREIDAGAGTQALPDEGSPRDGGPLTEEERELRRVVRYMEEEGESFETFFGLLGPLARDGKLALGTFLRKVYDSYPHLNGDDMKVLKRNLPVSG